MDAQDRNKLDNFKGMSVGKIFYNARTQQGFELEQIGTHLNIGTDHLEAIEADDKANLPPRVYAVGFVRAYADVLGLDSEKMAYLFKIQCYGQRKIDEQKNITTKRHCKTISTKAIIEQKMDEWTAHFIPVLFLILGISCVIGILWFFVWLVWPNSNENDDLRVPAVADVLVDEDPIEAQEFIQSGNDNVRPVEPSQLFVKPDNNAKSYGSNMLESDLVLKAVSDSWIDARNARDRTLILSRTLKSGEVFYVEKGIDIIMTTGNAGGLEVYLDGKSLGLMGAPKEVIRARVLSAQSLRLQNSE
jgi:cytoskeleton protein RodZ